MGLEFRRNELTDDQFSGRKEITQSDRKLSTETINYSENNYQNQRQTTFINERVFDLVTILAERFRKPVSLGTIISELQKEFTVNDIRNAIEDLKENAKIRKMPGREDLFELY